MPLGATLLDGATQFALFSRHATAVTLVLFDGPTASLPYAEISLDDKRNRTGDVWHVAVQGVGPGWCYRYRVDGPAAPEAGHRFDSTRLLFDPYAKAFTGALPPRRRPTAVPAAGPRCVVVADSFDWGDDRHPRHPLHRSLIYELHVRGFTAHPSAGVAHPGTFRGLTERIPYLRELGVTAVELLPVHESDEYAPGAPSPGDTGDTPLVNYWAYNPIGLFAPKRRYSGAEQPGGQVREFKAMVHALHAAGLEVILDMVFNHSPEGDATGPTLSYRGLDNSIYYLLDAADRSRYLDFTGCHNTLNCNHPVVRQMIIDCLHYWVVEMHVDGFRFDLASVLGRDRTGNLSANTPILEQIGEDPVLRDTKIIAEAWDAAGAYQVGQFPREWAELNDRFRDDVRRFWRGDGAAADLATRLAGSADLYQDDGRRPGHSINFITSHDGFTLHDLVSYAAKHNQANGEGNRDGSSFNLSANHGVEGPTDKPEIQTIRRRQSKNLLATLFLSLGTPLLLGGDEMARTQRGNNNAYCHDNELSWYDWSLRSGNAELVRFCGELAALRARHPALHHDAFYPAAHCAGGQPGVRWFDSRGEVSDWSSLQSHLAACLSSSAGDLFLMLNAATSARSFSIPAAPHGGAWYRLIDTALASPDDICTADRGILLTPQEMYRVTDRSLVLLAATAADRRD